MILNKMLESFINYGKVYLMEACDLEIIWFSAWCLPCFLSFLNFI